MFTVLLTRPGLALAIGIVVLEGVLALNTVMFLL